MPPASSPRMAPDRLAGSRCRARRVRRSGAAPGKLCAAVHRRRRVCCDRHRRGSRHDRITSSSTRCVTGSCVRCWTKARRRCSTSRTARTRRIGGDLLDTREPDDYASGHLLGAVNVGLQGRFAEGAGQVIPPDRDIVLVGDAELAEESKTRLSRVGFDRVIGQLRDLSSVLAERPDIVVAIAYTAEQLAELLRARPAIGRCTEPGGDRRRDTPWRTGDSDIVLHRFAGKPGQDGAGRHVLRQRLPVAGGGEPAQSSGL